MNISPTSSTTSEDRGYVFVSVPQGNTLPTDLPQRRRLNICRMWRSLSRFQRSVLWAILLLSVCSVVFVASTFYGDLRTLEKGLDVKPNKVNAEIVQNVAPPQVQAPALRSLSSTDNEPPPTASLAAAQVLLDKTEARVVLPKPALVPKFRGPDNERQAAVAAAFKHAWKGYKKYAWGHDHLKPISKEPHDWFGIGLTLIDSLDTMLIMGLNDDFNEAKQWVAEKLDFDVKKYVNLFETTIRCLAGLLSAYHLSAEPVFLEKAKDLGSRLIGAFDTPSKIPYSDINLSTKKGKGPGWSSDSSLSEATTLQLEFRDLSRLTGNPFYESIAYNVSLLIHKEGCDTFDGICPMYINPKTGKFRGGTTLTLGARTDSYYEYLLKQWLQTGKTVDWLKDDYVTAMQGVVKRLVRYSEPNKLTFVGELINEKTFSPKMDHLVCFLAGALALGATNGLPQEHMDYAKQLAHTCYQMYAVTKTGLAPEIAHFNMIVTPQKEDLYIKPLDAHSLLRPEAVESFFYLYRLTGEKIYQEWGWNVFQAIEKYAKVENGYSSIVNVKKSDVSYRDMMESFFLGETLKYLYLLLGNDQTVIPLQDFVFNTEAHPLPIYKS